MSPHRPLSAWKPHVRCLAPACSNRSVRIARCARSERCGVGGPARPRPTRSRRSAAPSALALVDERGTLTFAEVHRRTNALAHGLAAAGVARGDGVAIMCRNHRGFVEATVALLEARREPALSEHRLCRTPDRRRAAARGPTALIYDEEFADLVRARAARAGRDALDRAPGAGRPTVGRRRRAPCRPRRPALEDLIAAGDTTQTWSRRPSTAAW